MLPSRGGCCGRAASKRVRAPSFLVEVRGAQPETYESSPHATTHPFACTEAVVLFFFTRGHQSAAHLVTRKTAHPPCYAEKPARYRPAAQPVYTVYACNTGAYSSCQPVEVLGWRQGAAASFRHWGDGLSLRIACLLLPACTLNESPHHHHHRFEDTRTHAKNRLGCLHFFFFFCQTLGSET